MKIRKKTRQNYAKRKNYVHNIFLHKNYQQKKKKKHRPLTASPIHAAARAGITFSLTNGAGSNGKR